MCEQEFLLNLTIKLGCHNLNLVFWAESQSLCKFVTTITPNSACMHACVCEQVYAKTARWIIVNLGSLLASLTRMSWFDFGNHPVILCCYVPIGLTCVACMMQPDTAVLYWTYWPTGVYMQFTGALVHSCVRFTVAYNRQTYHSNHKLLNHIPIINC